jgi:hypothetical protein
VISFTKFKTAGAEMGLTRHVSDSRNAICRNLYRASPPAEAIPRHFVVDCACLHLANFDDLRILWLAILQLQAAHTATITSKIESLNIRPCS